jgi:hypothetical protein
MGIGATFGEGSSSAYVLWVRGKRGPRPSMPDWVAWPPRGFVPYPLVPDFWSFSYPEASFRGAKVTMRRNGTRIPVTLQRIQHGFGDNTLAWRPKGLPTNPPSTDERYSVTITGVSIGGSMRTFTYEVTVVDPESPVGVN